MLFTSPLDHKICCTYPSEEGALPALLDGDVLNVQIPAEACTQLSPGLLSAHLTLTHDDVTKKGTLRLAELLPYRDVAGHRTIPEQQLVFSDNDIRLSVDMGPNAAMNGLSAYELYRQHHPDLELTEAEYAAAPVTAAGEALAAAGDAAETERRITAAESLREQVEQVRNDAERLRSIAEEARVVSEHTRTTAEQIRCTAEKSRVADEQGRSSSEQSRVAAERNRATAEAARQTAEQSRVRAETARAGAEEQRQTATEAAIRRADEAAAAAAPVVETPTGADVALDVVGGREYICGTLTSLRLTSVAASPRLSIVRFSSGAAPTEFTYPDSLPITGWTIPQADTTYDLFIWQGAATIVYR